MFDKFKKKAAKILPKKKPVKKPAGKKPKPKPEPVQEKKETGITKTNEKKIVAPPIDMNNPKALMVAALQNQAGVEQLKELMKMKYEDEARESKKEFHHFFSKMQAALPEITKDKRVERKDGSLIYSYSSLGVTVKSIKPVMAEYGFSYSWSEEGIKDGWKRVHNHITGYGHTESTYVDIPIATDNSMTNKIQQMGSATTYGKRYSLNNSLGIISDEDDDGRSAGPGKAPDPKPDPKPPLKPVASSKTEEKPKEKKKEEPKQDPHPESREGLIKNCLDLCKKCGCKTVKDAQGLTGYDSLSDPSLPLKDLKDLEKELEVKVNADKKTNDEPRKIKDSEIIE